MRVTVKTPPQVDLAGLHAMVESLNVPGFAGVTISGAELHVEFPEVEDLPAADRARVAEALAGYQYAPSLVTIRQERAAAYPSLGDQLGALWKLLDPPAGTEAAAIKAQVEAVKAQHPKP